MYVEFGEKRRRIIMEYNGSLCSEHEKQTNDKTDDGDKSSAGGPPSPTIDRYEKFTIAQ
jgi:hypothetical protein